MKLKVNWGSIIIEIIKVIVAGLAGGAGATMM